MLLDFTRWTSDGPKRVSDFRCLLYQEAHQLAGSLDINQSVATTWITEEYQRALSNGEAGPTVPRNSTPSNKSRVSPLLALSYAFIVISTLTHPGLANLTWSLQTQDRFFPLLTASRGRPHPPGEVAGSAWRPTAAARTIATPIRRRRRP